jgi:hypothetical protein
VLDGIHLLLLLPTVEILRGVSFLFLPEHIVVKLLIMPWGRDKKIISNLQQIIFFLFIIIATVSTNHISYLFLPVPFPHVFGSLLSMKLFTSSHLRPVCILLWSFDSMDQTIVRHPPTAPPPRALPLYRLPTMVTDYQVDCGVKSLNDGHIRPPPLPSLYYSTG